MFWGGKKKGINYNKLQSNKYTGFGYWLNSSNKYVFILKTGTSNIAYSYSSSIAPLHVSQPSDFEQVLCLICYEGHHTVYNWEGNCRKTGVKVRI